jgi:CHAD domain-containing protein
MGHTKSKKNQVIGSTMSEVVFQTLLFHFKEMKVHEAGTLAGADINELHDMRVEVRRMRAAFQVYKGFLDEEQIKPFKKTLRRLGNILGSVRDLDVFHEKALQFIDTLPKAQKNDLKPLLNEWRIQRELHRSQMIAYLKSNTYVLFKRKFDKFLASQALDEIPFKDNKPVPFRVCQILPEIILKSYAKVCTYDEWLIDKENVPFVLYHQLRIVSKRLRYTLEFFKDLMGTDAQHLIKKITMLQDYLGELHDADVTCRILRNFLKTGKWSTGPNEISPAETNKKSGVVNYLFAREGEIRELISGFPSIWHKILGDGFRGRIRKITEKILDTRGKSNKYP